MGTHSSSWWRGTWAFGYLAPFPSLCPRRPAPTGGVVVTALRIGNYVHVFTNTSLFFISTLHAVPCDIFPPVFTFYNLTSFHCPEVTFCVLLSLLCSLSSLSRGDQKKKLYPGRKRPHRFFIKRKPHWLIRVDKTPEPWPMPERVKPRGEHSEGFFLPQQPEIRF